MKINSKAAPKQLTTCIVTCYNYGAFIQEAVSSILSQSTRFDEVIIVDDASSDDSATLLVEIANREKTIKVIRHEKNSGQLAAFETAILKSSGDLLFFLDADDIYAPNYLATAITFYQQIPQIDFLFCRNIQFSKIIPPSLLSGDRSCSIIPKVNDLGLSIVRTLERRVFIGAPTSCLSMRRRVATQLFPLPVHEDWMTRADDCLVFGASLAGARKFKIEADLVGYRIHGKNAFAENRNTGEPSNFFLRQIAISRLFFVLRQRFQLGKDVVKLAHLEFKTIPDPNFEDLREYFGYIIKNGAKDAGRLRGIFLVIKWYLKSMLNKKLQLK